MLRRWWMTIGVLAAAACVCPADRILLKSGASYTGTVEESTAFQIVFLAMIDGSETRMTFPRSAVRKIERGDIKPDPADSPWPAPEADSPQTDSDDAEGERPVRPEWMEVREEELIPEGPNVIVATMHGAFGEEILPIGLERVIEAADERGAEFIVLDIDSNGGAVWAATRMMELMEEASDRVRFVAVVRRGISASIWPIFSAHEVFVLPRSEVGAAVIFSGKTGEVSAKFNSAAAATLGSVAEDRGHSADVVRAMIIGPAELYATEDGDGGFTLSGSLPSNTPDDAAVHRLDDGDSVLTLTALEMERYGLARLIESADGRTLADALGADRWEASTIDASIMERWADACERRKDRVEELGTLLVGEVAAFQRSSGAGGDTGLDGMMTATSNLRRLIGRYVSAANQCHECFPDFQERIDREEIREVQARITEIQDAIRARRRARD